MSSNSTTTVPELKKDETENDQKPVLEPSSGNFPEVKIEEEESEEESEEDSEEETDLLEETNATDVTSISDLADGVKNIDLSRDTETNSTNLISKSVKIEIKEEIVDASFSNDEDFCMIQSGGTCGGHRKNIITWTTKGISFCTRCALPWSSAKLELKNLNLDHDKLNCKGVELLYGGLKIKMNEQIQRNNAMTKLIENTVNEKNFLDWCEEFGCNMKSSDEHKELCESFGRSVRFLDLYLNGYIDPKTARHKRRVYEEELNQKVEQLLETMENPNEDIGDLNEVNEIMDRKTEEQDEEVEEPNKDVENEDVQKTQQRDGKKMPTKRNKKAEEPIKKKQLTGNAHYCYILADASTLKTENVSFGDYARTTEHFNKTLVNAHYKVRTYQQENPNNKIPSELLTSGITEVSHRKYRNMFELWMAGGKVLLQYVLEGTYQSKSELFEDCMIEAIGKDNLTNELSGVTINTDKLKLAVSKNKEVFGLDILRRAYKRRHVDQRFTYHEISSDLTEIVIKKTICR